MIRQEKGLPDVGAESDGPGPSRVNKDHGGPVAFLRFLGELPQYLGRDKAAGQGACQPLANGGVLVRYAVSRRASIKDVIEALGPPHVLVGRITVNGRERDFSHLLRPGDDATIYSLKPPVDVFTPSLLRPEPLKSLAFLVDANVGRLAGLLRLLGLNAAHDRAWDDAEIALRAEQEGRIILSRDRALLKRSRIVFGHLVQSQEPREQLGEVVAHFGLKPPFAVFSRCMRCNELLRTVAKQAIEHRLLPKTRKYYHEFKICPACDKIYWRGSHFEHMTEWVEGLSR